MGRSGKRSRFDHYDHLLQAAAEGQGIGLGYDVIVSSDIEFQRLVRLFDVEYPARILYSLVTPKPGPSVHALLLSGLG